MDIFQFISAFLPLHLTQETMNVSSYIEAVIKVIAVLHKINSVSSIQSHVGSSAVPQLQVCPEEISPLSH